MSKPSKNDPVAQHACFVETARAFGCDEDETAFDEKLKLIAKPQTMLKPAQAKPSPEQP